MGNTAEYNAAYYRRRKYYLSRRRKDRYLEDPGYRERIRRASKEAYEQRSVERIPKDRMAMMSDNGERLLSIGRIGMAINRKPVTIRAYHREGIIPELNNYDSRGWRLYTFHQARLLQRAFSALDAGEMKSLAEVAEFLHKEWE